MPHAFVTLAKKLMVSSRCLCQVCPMKNTVPMFPGETALVVVQPIGFFLQLVNYYIHFNTVQSIQKNSTIFLLFLNTWENLIWLLEEILLVTGPFLWKTYCLLQCLWITVSYDYIFFHIFSVYFFPSNKTIHRF